MKEPVQLEELTDGPAEHAVMLGTMELLSQQGPAAPGPGTQFPVVPSHEAPNDGVPPASTQNCEG